MSNILTLENNCTFLFTDGVMICFRFQIV
uniref:Uncharacterized protein n=1 Tax=Arundo donax TaxID=35708 RepID=A0A0A9EP16_ARUDO